MKTDTRLHNIGIGLIDVSSAIDCLEMRLNQYDPSGNLREWCDDQFHMLNQTIAAVKGEVNKAREELHEAA